MSPVVVSTATTPTERVRASAVIAAQRLVVHGPVEAALMASDVLLARVRPTNITSATLGTLYPELPAAERMRLLRSINRDFGRSRIVDWYVRHRDPQTLRGIISTSGFDRIRSGPAIFLNFHFGGWPCLETVLRWQGFESLVITAVPWRRNGALLRVGSTLEERTTVGQQAAAHLRKGGCVLMAGDGIAGETGVRVPVLSQRPLVRPGLGVLARLSGAPVFPVSGIWRGRRLHVELHEPLDLPAEIDREAFLDRTAAAVGSWVDGQLRQTPSGLTPYLVRWLFNAQSVMA
jgi:lauroyl/myristoyl acyltransferase